MAGPQNWRFLGKTGWSPFRWAIRNHKWSYVFRDASFGVSGVLVAWAVLAVGYELLETWWPHQSGRAQMTSSAWLRWTTRWQSFVPLTCLRSFISIGCLVPEILPIEFWKFMTSSKVGQARWRHQHASPDKFWHCEHNCKVWLQSAEPFGRYTCVGNPHDNRPIPIENALAAHLKNLGVK